MTLQIEDTPCVGFGGRQSADFKAFLDTLQRLEVGQSFLFAKMQSTHRTAITTAQHLLTRTFVTRAEGAQFRIGRIG